jgi:pSer/pThr/pTyr-binding forkhead associated (FHA) protein
MLTDMGSRNGTYVNNEKVRARALVNGDAIVVGDCQLRFLYSRALPPVDALRLMTQPGELMGVDAHMARSLNRRLPERRVFAR